MWSGWGGWGVRIVWIPQKNVWKNTFFLSKKPSQEQYITRL
ncbi:hypothetical protein [Okeania sp. SIO3I5]|nr:hypothetical protein [Okeania sp. SIO3I5]